MNVEDNLSDIDETDNKKQEIYVDNENNIQNGLNIFGDDNMINYEEFNFQIYQIMMKLKIVMMMILK